MYENRCALGDSFLPKFSPSKEMHGVLSEVSTNGDCIFIFVTVLDISHDNFDKLEQFCPEDIPSDSSYKNLEANICRNIFLYIMFSERDSSEKKGSTKFKSFIFY